MKEPMICWSATSCGPTSSRCGSSPSTSSIRRRLNPNRNVPKRKPKPSDCRPGAPLSSSSAAALMLQPSLVDGRKTLMTRNNNEQKQSNDQKRGSNGGGMSPPPPDLNNAQVSNVEKLEKDLKSQQHDAPIEQHRSSRRPRQ